jgi:hypothetical protein
VPGNGCHQLPATPCERGHGGTEIGNKHCGPDLAILKEQALCGSGAWTHGTVSTPLNVGDWCYRVTITNFSNTAYTLTGSDPICDPTQDPGAVASDDLSDSNSLSPLGTDVYTCEIDPTWGTGLPGDSIPSDPATAGPGPFPLTNSVTFTATPVGGGTAVTLTDSVTANFTN